MKNQTIGWRAPVLVQRCSLPILFAAMSMGLPGCLAPKPKVPSTSAIPKSEDPSALTKGLRGKPSVGDWGTGIDDRARDIESNLGFK